MLGDSSIRMGDLLGSPRVAPLYLLTAPLSDSLDLDVSLSNCLVLKKDRELQVNLILLNFNVILGMDWLS